MKLAKKHSAISIYDYPKNNYSAHWEYVVAENADGKTGWTMRVLANDDGRVLDEHKGVAANEHEARVQAQAKVSEVIVNYKRRKPLKVIGEDEAAKLAREFDEARAVVRDPASTGAEKAAAFSRIDRIRGLLKANGHVLAEGTSIMDDGATKVQKPLRGAKWLLDTLRRFVTAG